MMQKNLSFWLMLAICCLPAIAQAAMQVVNISGAPQRIWFDQAGKVTERILADGERVFFYGAEGMLGIDTAFQTRKASNAKPGMVSRILGEYSANNRTSMIPITRNDVFMIWPDGRLLLQYRRRQNKGGR